MASLTKMCCSKAKVHRNSATVPTLELNKIIAVLGTAALGTVGLALGTDKLGGIKVAGSSAADALTAVVRVGTHVAGVVAEAVHGILDGLLVKATRLVGELRDFVKSCVGQAQLSLGAHCLAQCLQRLKQLT
jgi:hypothetical protein